MKELRTSYFLTYPRYEEQNTSIDRFTHPTPPETVASNSEGGRLGIGGLTGRRADSDKHYDPQTNIKDKDRRRNENK